MEMDGRVKAFSAKQSHSAQRPGMFPPVSLRKGGFVDDWLVPAAPGVPHLRKNPELHFYCCNILLLWFSILGAEGLQGKQRNRSQRQLSGQDGWWWVITRVMRQQRLVDLFTGSQSTVPLIYKSKFGQGSLMDKQQKDVFLILLWPTSCFPFVPIQIHYLSFPVGVQTPWASPLMSVLPSLRVTSIWGGKAKENGNDAALLKTARI